MLDSLSACQEERPQSQIFGVVTGAWCWAACRSVTNRLKLKGKNQDFSIFP